MQNDPRTGLFTELEKIGAAPNSPAALVADGQIHRHHIEGDKPGSQNGWHVLHRDDPASGAGGSWKAGTSAKWCSKRRSALTASERAEIARRITEDRKRAQEATERRHREAAAKAARIWAQAAPASPDHQYLVDKGISPGIARQSGNLLVLPITAFDGDLRGVQTISPTGEKRFTTGMHKAGGFICTDQMPSPDRRLLIGEGWGTGMSLSELSPGDCVIAALDAGNLLPVAAEARRRFPKIDLVICADADQVGMEKAKAAAVASRAKWIWPRFPKDAPEGLSDFNDWVTWRRNQRRESSHV